MQRCISNKRFQSFGGIGANVHLICRFFPFQLCLFELRERRRSFPPQTSLRCDTSAAAEPSDSLRHRLTRMEIHFLIMGWLLFTVFFWLACDHVRACVDSVYGATRITFEAERSRANFSGNNIPLANSSRSKGT